jgi:hypothetical protein
MANPPKKTGKYSKTGFGKFSKSPKSYSKDFKGPQDRYSKSSHESYWNQDADPSKPKIGNKGPRFGKDEGKRYYSAKPSKYANNDQKTDFDKDKSLENRPFRKAKNESSFKKQDDAFSEKPRASKERFGEGSGKFSRNAEGGQARPFRESNDRSSFNRQDGRRPYSDKPRASNERFGEGSGK